MLWSWPLSLDQLFIYLFILDFDATLPTSRTYALQPPALLLLLHTVTLHIRVLLQSIELRSGGLSLDTLGAMDDDDVARPSADETRVSAADVHSCLYC